MAVDDHLLIENAAITAELALPKGMTQHGDVVAADRLVVVRRQQAAERRAHAEDREVRARDENAPSVDRSLSCHRDVHAEQEMGGDPAERRVRALQVAEHRIAEHFLAVPRHVAGGLAVVRSRRGELDEPVGMRHRQRLEEHLVEERIDRRIRADAERQREDSDDRYEWCSK